MITHKEEGSGKKKKMAHYFTREEAEALLPEISVVLNEIKQKRAAIQDLEKELGTLEARARGNGHGLHERIAKLQVELARLVQALRTLGAKLEVFGCELKDSETGLIDFLSMREERPVYLCWRLGEERINYWHELNAGFSGRQPL